MKKQLSDGVYIAICELISKGEAIVFADKLINQLKNNPIK